MIGCRYIFKLQVDYQAWFPGGTPGIMLAFNRPYKLGPLRLVAPSLGTSALKRGFT